MRRSARGFALAEALVALSVAVLTLALLTGATWGLRQTNARPDLLRQDAADWLTARRVLQAWAASATTAGAGNTAGRFSGAPTRMRLILDDGTTAQARPMMVGLDIAEADGRYTLQASRILDIRDIRLATDDARQSTLIVSDTPLRLLYLVARSGDLPGQVWADAPDPEQGLPAAIAVEQGNDRVIVARIPATRSALCIARLGEAGLSDRDCRLR